MGDLSKNFSNWEFKCRCCSQVNMKPEFIEQLQIFRDRLDRPFIPTNGFRCPTHNKKIGGHANSYHLHGMAVDGVAPGRSLVSLYLEALVVPGFRDGGIGLYPQWEDDDGEKHDGFIHLNIGRKSRWGRVRGKYCSLHKAVTQLKQEATHVDSIDTNAVSTNPGTGS